MSRPYPPGDAGRARASVPSTSVLGRLGEAWSSSRPRRADGWWWSRARRRNVTTVVLLGVTTAFYWFIASAGKLRDWPTYNVYYTMLAEAFRRGQLSFLQRPAPALVASPDPYHPSNSGLWLWDTSLFEGKFYAYWGPFPAVLEAVGQYLLDREVRIGDQYLVFGCVLAASATSALIVTRLVSRLFPDAPSPLVALGVLAVGLANPVPYLLGRAGVYEAAIAAGQWLLLAGIVPAFDAVWYRDDPKRRPFSSLTVAGVAWGLALASRVTLLPAIALLMVGTVIGAVEPGRGRWRRAVAAAACLALPVIASGAILLLYNKARFHSWLEFGVTYQLTTMTFKLSPSYIVANLYSYLWRQPQWTCQFPFAHANWGHVPLPGWIAVQPGYAVGEPLVGLLVATPLAWLGLATMPRVARTVLTAIARRPLVLSKWSRSYLWCTFSFLVLGSVTGAVALTVYMATMRYLADAIYGFSLLGVLGALTLWSRGGRVGWRSALVQTAIAATMVATIVAGALLGYQGYYQHVATGSPQLHERLVKALSLCD